MIAKQEVEKILKQADIKINGPRPWDIKVHDERFYSRVLAHGSLGAGEAYMDGWWDVKKLDQFFAKLIRAHAGTGAVRKLINAKFVWDVLRAKVVNMQTISRSKEVAKRHYDLGNGFYEEMLDKRMQYTCGYWRNAKNLDEAQKNKLDLVCRKLGLKKGDHILELGSGFGWFAKYAAENYGCKVTCYNISKEQVKYGKKICKGLPVKFRLQDYRKARGKYDHVVSIGLCEHVGPKNYRSFMKLASSCMRDNGLFLLHTIGKNITTAKTDAWISKYVFPGGHIPSLKNLASAAEKIFVIEDVHNFGSDYDKTLMEWYKNFDKNWNKWKPYYGDRFYRMWKYYLLACAGAFRARSMQLWQLVLSKNGVEGGYRSIR